MFNAAFFVSLCVIVISAFVAYVEGNWSTRQHRLGGITKGLPFTRHLGMWSDVFLVTPAIGIVWKYHDQWKWYSVLAIFAGALAITKVMHDSWKAGAHGQEHILSKYGLTISGYLHMLFMTLTLTAVALFYFTGISKAPGDELLVAVLLGIHVPIGTIGVSMMKVGKPDQGSVVTTLVSWAALAVALIW